MTIVFLFSAITLLISINAFYVAAEFSAVSVRRPRLAQLSDQGNARARFVLDIVETPHRLDTYVAACQVGITVSSLALGFYGQSRILELLSPLLGRVDLSVRILATSITSVAILLSLTILQVILGELLPKNVGLLHPERLAVFTASGMLWSMRVLRPLIWLFNGSGIIVLRLLGAEAASDHSHVHSPDEIEILVEESSAGGVLDAEERRLFLNTLRLRNVTAQRTMIPRNSMLAAPVTASCEELLSLLAESPYSRLPLYSENIDSVVGAVHLKDLMCAVHTNRNSDVSHPLITPEDCLHPVLFVPELADVEEVMRSLQAHHQILAIVVDEYGGTAGMITLEDLIEEIVGDFNDEFDVEAPPIEVVANNRLRMRGDVSVDNVIEILDIEFQARSVESIGGLVLTAAGRIPTTGEIVDVQGIPMRIDRVVGNRVAYVSIPISSEQTSQIAERLQAM